MIFLSYSWKDQAAAHKIDALLRANGLKVWIDFRQLDPSGNITHQLDLAIRECSIFLAVRPSSRYQSPWMETEFLLARKYRKPIVYFAAGVDVLITSQQTHIGSFWPIATFGLGRRLLSGQSSQSY